MILSAATDTRFALSRLQHCGDYRAVTIDAVNYAIHMLKRRQNHYRRAVLLISETRDHGSRSTLHEVVAELGVSDTVIYSIAFSPAREQLKELLLYGEEGPRPPPPAPSPYPIGPPRASAKPPTPTPTPTPSAVTPEAIYLDHTPAFSLPPALALVLNALRHSTASELASLSGGEYINFTTPKSFEQALQRVSNHVRDYYLLSFKPASPTMGLHSLRVRVPDYPDAVIQTRRSYWSGILDVQPLEGK